MSDETTQRGAFRYTPYFCEENIWWLARDLIARGEEAEAMAVWIVTNQSRQVLMLNQRATDPGAPLGWDYHVILKAGAGRPRVFDFDSRLSFPCDIHTYLASSFPRQSSLPQRYRAWIRTVAADQYLAHFFSDRSHMRGVLPPEDFPDYPIITPEPGVEPISLQQYLDLNTTLPDGTRFRPLETINPET